MDKEKTLRKLQQEHEEVLARFGVEFAAVVRCQDCKHLYGGKFCAFSVVRCKPDGFCSHGEKS